MRDELLIFNGVDGATGRYLLSPMSPEQISRVARGDRRDPDHLRELRWWYRRVTEAFFGPKEGVDPTDLAQAGWGVIFSHDADERIVHALRPLLDHRQAQAGRTHERRYREFTGCDGYRPGESKQQFLARHGVAPGPADPDKVPYYLLIVGGPKALPYAFQYQLDVQYAVGRIGFERIEDYAAYATSVVAAETSGSHRPKRATFFGARNPGDRATELSAGELVAPLVEHLSASRPDWEVQQAIGEAATKARLGELLGGDGHVPALLFTATHGVGFPSGHPHQLRRQGALLCQDWPGPDRAAQMLSEEHYFSADDVAADAQLAGLISCHFACFGGGTPQWDDYAHGDPRHRLQLAPEAFLAALPQRLLSHPKGGALAVIGHVDRAWGYSFVWPQNICRNSEGRCRGVADEGSPGRLTVPNPKTTSGIRPGHPLWPSFDTRSQAGRQTDVCRNSEGRCRGVADEGSPGRLTVPNPKTTSGIRPGHPLWPSFDTRSQAGRQTDVFEGCLLRLMEGQPIGYAFEYFNQRYAELASDLSTELEDVKFGKRPNHEALAAMWTAHNDARGLTIRGDPAVRVVGGPAAVVQAREIAAVVAANGGQAAVLEAAVPASLPLSEQPPARMEPDPAVDFGLRDGLIQALERLVGAVQTLTTTLSDTLQRAVEAVTVLEVATYVSNDLAAATYDRATKQFSGGAKLRAFSRITIDGDSVLLLPEELDEVDAALWALHVGMVEQARAARAELLKTAGSAVAGLLDALKVL